MHSFMMFGKKLGLCFFFLALMFYETLRLLFQERTGNKKNISTPLY